MKTKTVKRRAAAFKRRPAKLWQLRLYVMDSTPKSQTAFSNLKQLCETHLKGRYRITVIDLLKRPQLAKGDQIQVIGSRVKADGADLVLAREVTRRETTLILRDKNGEPFWNHWTRPTRG